MDASTQAANDDRQTDVAALMDRYIDGLHHADSKILRTVFHPDLAYINGTLGTYEYLDLEAYMTRIDKREAPAARGDIRNGVIERINFKGNRIGVVEARMTMLGRDYSDILTLIKTDTGWRVVTKVFTFVEERD